MGFTTCVKGYRLWCLESKIIYIRNVTFDESSILKNQHEIPHGDRKWPTIGRTETPTLKRLDKNRVGIGVDRGIGDVEETNCEG